MESPKIDEISKKNLGQLLGTLDSLNSSDAVKAIVKTFFWKNSDEIKNELILCDALNLVDGEGR